MNRRHFLGAFAASLGALSWRPASLFAQPKAALAAPGAATGPTQPISGVVFHDRDSSGVLRLNSPGVPRVAVSNGRDVVLTDARGRYTLQVAEHDIVFVVKPRNWAVPLNAHKLPQHWRAHKPNGSPRFKYPGHAATKAAPTMDFALRPQVEGEKFRALLFGDPQPRNIQEIDWTMRDVLAELQGVDAAFGLALGDDMFDNLELYPQLNGAFATLGMPWHHTLGNHDMNYDSPDDRHSDETFSSIYGPSTYAFNYGPVHFLILNNVVWGGAGNRKNAYTSGLNADQLSFVAGDLRHVPRESLLVVAMHIPPHEPAMPMAGRDELYALLADRPNVLALSAHTHVQSHEFIGAKDGWKGPKPLHHLNHATVCGSWWTGAPDETGIPHTTMRDGAPNGYSFLNFDGASYTIDFKAARQPEEHQMSISLPDEVKAGQSPQIVVNVFAGSERSKVEMKIGAGEWAALGLSPRQDPMFAALKALEEGPTPPPGRKLPKFYESRHIWAAPLPGRLPAGTHTLQVRTTDMWGRTWSARRLVRVV